MKKHAKKILSMLLLIVVIVLSAGLLTACGETKYKDKDYTDRGNATNGSNIAYYDVKGKTTQEVLTKFVFRGTTGYYEVSGLLAKDERYKSSVNKLKLTGFTLCTNPAPSSPVKTINIGSKKCYYLQQNKKYYCRSFVQNDQVSKICAKIQLKQHTDTKPVKKTENYKYKPSMIWRDRNFMQDFGAELPGNVIRDQTVMKIWLNRTDLSNMINVYSNSDEIGSLYDAAIKYFKSNNDTDKSKAKQEIVNEAKKLAEKLAKKASKKALTDFVKAIAKSPSIILNAINFISWGIDTAKTIFNIKSELVERGNDLIKAMKADDSLADCNIRDGVRSYLSGVIVTINWRHSSTLGVNANFQATTSYRITEQVSFKRWNDEWGKKTSANYTGANIQIGDFYYWNSKNGSTVYNNWAKEYNRKVSINGKTLYSEVLYIRT